MKMPLDNVASLEGFHLATGEKQRITYEITILRVFFSSSSTIVGSDKMFFSSQMMSWYGIKF